LDGVQRLKKAVLFERLYELWTKNGLISERIAKWQFEENSESIVDAILDTFEEKRKQYIITIESMHITLKKGKSFMTTEDKLIHCTKEENKK